MDPWLFTGDWAAACQREVNASAAYKEAAATWESPVAFIVDHEGESRGVYVDLWRGECREARALAVGDEDLAQFIIRGDQATWLQVLGGHQEPLVALATGQLKLAKGNLGALAFHIKSARELVAAACRVHQQRATAS